MITIQQIKAARSLLDWNQQDLAKASGVSVPAIARLELGTCIPRTDTLNAIKEAFEKQGIEFNDDIGLNLRREIFKLETYNGLAGMDHVWSDMVATMTARGGGEILMAGVGERVWVNIYGDRLGEEIKRRRKLGITHRLLINEDDNLCLGSSDVYRWVPEDLYGRTSTFIYDERYVLVTMETSMTVGSSMKIVLIHNATVANAFRKQFEFHWKLGKPVINPEVLYPIN